MDAPTTPGGSGAPTISDVAREAGVSVATVSNYLNGTARLSPTTYEAVQAATEKLGYVPNFNARSLRAQSTKTIGLLVPNLINPFYTEMAASMERTAQEHGYQLMLCSSADDGDLEGRQIRTLLHRRVDGAVMVALEPTELGDRIRGSRFPIVCADRRIPGHRSITSDNRMGGRLALEHLVELGHRRIGMVVGDDHVENVKERVAGAREVLDRHGIEVSERSVVRGPQSLDTGVAAARLWDEPDPPTAVFATNDIIAMGLYRVCHDRGLRIPEDVSVVGFDDVRWTELIVPTLTTVHQDVDEMVTRALDVLLEAIRSGSGDGAPDGYDLGEAHETLGPDLRVRESTAAQIGGR